jgi:hypothetical protein
VSRAAAVLALATALALAGCATVPAPPPAPRAPAGAAAAAPAPPAPQVRALTPAPLDSAPSADALAVLAGIPEPLGATERVAAPAAPAPARAAPAPARTAPAPADTGSSEPADADGGQADIPVPARMPVLGERPLPDVVAPVEPPGPAGAPVAPARVPSPPAAAPAPATADTCWRVQLAAWADRVKAERYLAAARSQLGVPLAVEKLGGLFKVRTSGCLDGTAADALRRRAHDAGFDGAFRFRGGRP